jgi:hypothetical protein
MLLVGVGGGYYLLHQEDHRNEPYYYEKVAGFVEKDAKVVSISQDYGNRIAFYGWIVPKQWKSTVDVAYIQLTGGTEDPFLERFEAYTSGYDYFLVTSLNQLRKQEDLYNHLNDQFTVHVEGGGYIIYDLNQKK